MVSLKQLKQLSWNTYNQLRKKPIYCPLLNVSIYFTLTGWNHLIGQSGHKKRKAEDIYRRLTLIQVVKKVIQTSEGSISEKKLKDKVFYILETNISRQQKVTVFLFKRKDNIVIFYSIMDKAIKKRSASHP